MRLLSLWYIMYYTGGRLTKFGHHITHAYFIPTLQPASVLHLGDITPADKKDRFVLQTKKRNTFMMNVTTFTFTVSKTEKLWYRISQLWDNPCCPVKAGMNKPTVDQ